MKFKAAILVELKKPLVIEEIETPPLRFGQVLVQILCSGICGAQINEIEGAKGPDKFLPHLLGHEATAVVVECGEGVTTVKPGDARSLWKACLKLFMASRGLQRAGIAGCGGAAISGPSIGGSDLCPQFEHVTFQTRGLGL